MLKTLCLCAAGVLVIAASFIPAPDLDAPKVYYKACIYCQDCRPKQVVWDIIFTAYVPQGDCYRCQRTGKRMVFDSVGVVVWGKYAQIEPVYWQSGIETGWDSWPFDYQYTYLRQDSTTIEYRAVIADTSGLKRLE